MTIQSFAIILSRQVKQKFTTFLLSSGGIVIGIWAITLTSALSFGLSNSIVTAINSQPLARSFSISGEEFGIKEIDQWQARDDIAGVSPKGIIDLEIYHKTDFNLEELDQLALQYAERFPEEYKMYQELRAKDQISPEMLQGLPLFGNTTTLYVESYIFDKFYEENKTRWYGSTAAPKEGEIAMCFQCGFSALYEKLEVETPEEMVGKQIEVNVIIDIFDPSVATNGEEEEIGRFGLRENQGDEADGIVVPETNLQTFTITSVVDDREFNLFSPDQSVYLPWSLYQSIGAGVNEDGFFESADLFVNDYDDLPGIVKDFESQGYYVSAPVLDLVKQVQTAFDVIVYILGGFGFIALIASIFGIVNVITISVLERRKEIGILKSLGTRSRSIFVLFLMESAFLGFVGWAIGTLIAVVTGWITTLVTRNLFQSTSWGENLKALNIDSFNPAFPFGLLLTTLIIALVVTGISGLIPSIKAARQNPVDVLRGE